MGYLWVILPIFLVGLSFALSSFAYACRGNTAFGETKPFVYGELLNIICFIWLVLLNISFVICLLNLFNGGSQIFIK